ncbi:MAG TPA: preprotein translocase subunit YajC [Pseudolysinimonas sp.]|nr:preprotein translocase subunit YajC [Pseudolysinimonas sp.]
MQFNDPITIGLFALIAVMIFFMFRNSRKRKADAEDMQKKLVPGADVMTQSGIFGTLVSINDDTNEAFIETTPGNVLRVHRQTLAKVVEPEPIVSEEATEPAGIELNTDSAIPATDPEFGERTTPEKPKRAPRKKTTE